MHHRREEEKTGFGGWFQVPSFINWNHSWATVDAVATSVWTPSWRRTRKPPLIAASSLALSPTVSEPLRLSPPLNSRLTLPPHRCPSFWWALWLAEEDEQSGFLWIPWQWEETRSKLEEQINIVNIPCCCWEATIAKNILTTSTLAASLHFRLLLNRNYLQNHPRNWSVGEAASISKEL